MNATKDDYIKIRIHPAKKEALFATAQKRQIDVSKLLMLEIEKLIDNTREGLQGEGMDHQESDLTQKGQTTFRPLPGDELLLKRYAAKRQMKPATVVKLLLRAWATGEPLVPKEELGKLELLSNRIAAIGRLINQFVRLANTGQIEATQELVDLIKAVQPLIDEARAETKNFIAANLKSWEVDYG